MGDSNTNLPPGFQFQPTDEELVVHYLYHKAALSSSHTDIIPDLGFLLYSPSEYNGKAFWSGGVYYFFNKVTEDESNATESGYWKDLNIERPIFSSAGDRVGVKKLLVFYAGKSPKGTKTSWVLQQYRLINSNKLNNQLKHGWVLCRVHECKGDPATAFCSEDDDDELELSCMDEMFLSDLDDITFPN